MALDHMTISGIWPAFPTPLTPANELSPEALGRLIASLLAGGVNGLVPIGGTGEFTALSPRARTEVVEKTVAATCGKVPVVPGVLSPGLAEALQAGREFQAAGAAALMLITPFYVTPTQQGIRDYFKRYRDTIDIPLLLYDIPYRTRIVVEADTIAGMVEDGTIVGMKACNTDFTHFSRVMASVGGRIAVMSGEDWLFPAHVAMGAVGGVLATASMIPAIWTRIFASARSGQLQEALVLHRKLFGLLDAIFAETNPGPLKEAIAAMGLPIGSVLPPLQRPSAATMAKIEDALAALRREGLLPDLSKTRAAAE